MHISKKKIIQLLELLELLERVMMYDKQFSARDVNIIEEMQNIIEEYARLYK